MTIHLASTTLLFVDGRRPGPFVATPNRAWFGPLIRLLGCSLDRQLATGRPPESNRLLAARALWLVSPPTRMALAGNWEAVLARAHTPPIPRSPRAPLGRDRIIAAEAEIEALVHALSAPVPTPARGPAMASWLLCDGAGPLYNPRSPTELDGALRDAVTQLDPWTPLGATAAGDHVEMRH